MKIRGRSGKKVPVRRRRRLRLVLVMVVVAATPVAFWLQDPGSMVLVEERLGREREAWLAARELPAAEYAALQARTAAAYLPQLIREPAGRQRDEEILELLASLDEDASSIVAPLIELLGMRATSGDPLALWNGAQDVLVRVAGAEPALEATLDSEDAFTRYGAALTLRRRPSRSEHSRAITTLAELLDEPELNVTHRSAVLNELLRNDEPCEAATPGLLAIARGEGNRGLRAAAIAAMPRLSRDAGAILDELGIELLADGQVDLCRQALVARSLAGGIDRRLGELGARLGPHHDSLALAIRLLEEPYYYLKVLGCELIHLQAPTLNRDPPAELIAAIDSDARRHALRAILTFEHGVGTASERAAGCLGLLDTETNRLAMEVVARGRPTPEVVTRLVTAIADAPTFLLRRAAARTLGQLRPIPEELLDDLDDLQHGDHGRDAQALAISISGDLGVLYVPQVTTLRNLLHSDDPLIVWCAARTLGLMQRVPLEPMEYLRSQAADCEDATPWRSSLARLQMRSLVQKLPRVALDEHDLPGPGGTLVVPAPSILLEQVLASCPGGELPPALADYLADAVPARSFTAVPEELRVLGVDDLITGAVDHPVFKPLLDVGYLRVARSKTGSLLVRLVDGAVVAVEHQDLHLGLVRDHFDQWRSMTPQTVAAIARPHCHDLRELLAWGAGGAR